MANNQRQNAMYITSGDVTNTNSVACPYPGTLGRYVSIATPAGVVQNDSGNPLGQDKVFQYVRVDSNLTTAPFQSAVAWWKNRATYTVTTSPNALGRNHVAGIFCNAPTAGNYTYIQTAGLALVKFINSPTAAPTSAGLIVIPSAEAGKADCLAAGSAATYSQIGISAGALDTAVGNITANVLLTIPDLP